MKLGLLKKTKSKIVLKFLFDWKENSNISEKMAKPFQKFDNNGDPLPNNFAVCITECIWVFRLNFSIEGRLFFDHYWPLLK